MKSSWQKTLANSLTSLLQNKTNPRLVVIGIGNELNGDDAAGLLVIRALREKLADRPDLLFLEGHTAPENFSKPIREFAPDLLLIVDAADTGGRLEAGSIVLLEMDAVDGLSASTHTLPPTVFAKFIQHEVNCKVLMLGIQVIQVDFDRPVSPRILQAVEEASQGLIEELKKL